MAIRMTVITAIAVKERSSLTNIVLFLIARYPSRVITPLLHLVALTYDIAKLKCKSSVLINYAKSFVESIKTGKEALLSQTL